MLAVRRARHLHDPQRQVDRHRVTLQLLADRGMVVGALGPQARTMMLAAGVRCSGGLREGGGGGGFGEIKKELRYRWVATAHIQVLDQPRVVKRPPELVYTHWAA